MGSDARTPSARSFSKLSWSILAQDSGSACFHADARSVLLDLLVVPESCWPGFMDKVVRKREPQVGARGVGPTRPINRLSWQIMITGMQCDRRLVIDCTAFAVHNAASRWHVTRNTPMLTHEVYSFHDAYNSIDFPRYSASTTLTCSHGEHESFLRSNRRLDMACAGRNSLWLVHVHQKGDYFSCRARGLCSPHVVGRTTRHDIRLSVHLIVFLFRENLASGQFPWLNATIDP